MSKPTKTVMYYGYPTNRVYEIEPSIAIVLCKLHSSQFSRIPNESVGNTDIGGDVSLYSRAPRPSELVWRYIGP
ncbi:hypothetical protein GCM10025859_48810 [Alicyclobacillus fastidiosus]|nr:hypothetical protein GCM10025859_48810 [Alicyclobacillus fastidiosus]